MTPHHSRRQFLKAAAAIPALGVSAIQAVAADDPMVLPAPSQTKNAQRTQVLVIGAGASGVPAAIAAARAGAKVVLIEEDPTPGGAPVDMYVAMICGGPVVGLYAEMTAQLDRHFSLNSKPGGAWFMPSAYAQVVSRMIRAEPNLELRCGAPVGNVLLGEGTRNRVRGVTLHHVDGRRETILADVVIDATGAGAVAAMAGAECRYGTEAQSDFHEPLGPQKSSNRVQLCTLMLVSQRLRLDAKIDPARVAGMNCQAENANAVLHWAGTVACHDTRDPRAVAVAQQEALQKIEEDVAYLYENGYVAHIAPKLGVRESRRVVGDHILTVNDLVAPKRPDDTVAVGVYPLDAWGDQHGGFGKATLTYTPGGYGIPFRTLLTAGFENLLVVGKCLSATHLAMSAIRVQCIAAQTGQAAGIAAALAVTKQTNLRSIPVREIQTQLKAAGISF
ncbi:MAG: FAD-dependent oxidoreductase [Thermoguttaceae bacterium]